MAGQPFEIDKYFADAGDVGGDYQLGPARSRQFAQKRDDGTYTVITEYAYTTPGNLSAFDAGEFYGRRHGYSVCNQTEIMHCRDLEDIGGSEIHSDIEYDDVPYMTIATKRDADALARTFIQRLSIEHYGWDPIS